MIVCGVQSEKKKEKYVFLFTKFFLQILKKNLVCFFFYVRGGSNTMKITSAPDTIRVGCITQLDTGELLIPSINLM